MVGIYVGATSGYSGKNMIAMGIGLKLQKEGYRVGYMKPVGALPQEKNGVLGDADAFFVQDILGQNELDTILSDRDDLNKRIKEILDSTTGPWGMHVVMVTMRDVSLPENMLRAIARQAEAEREKRARIILAEGECQASKKMNEAADMYENKPSALKLREFQTLTEIAKEKNLIVVSTGSDSGHKDSDLPLFIGLARAVAGNNK